MGVTEADVDDCEPSLVAVLEWTLESVYCSESARTDDPTGGWKWCGLV